MIDHNSQQSMKDAFEAIHRDIKRYQQDITLIAVSKKQSIDKMVYLYDLGQRHFAESYLQEAVLKIQMLPKDIHWHYIGKLQSRKCVEIAQSFDWVQGVTRSKEVERLAEGAKLSNKCLNVCVQVNIDSDPNKSGVSADAIDDLVASIHQYPSLQFRGLMCILADQQNSEQQHHSFTRMYQLFERLQAQHHHCGTLSMGMSGDYPLALSCGATMIRVGTRLFGVRE